MYNQTPPDELDRQPICIIGAKNRSAGSDQILVDTRSIPIDLEGGFDPAALWFLIGGIQFFTQQSPPERSRSKSRAPSDEEANLMVREYLESCWKKNGKCPTIKEVRHVTEIPVGRISRLPVWREYRERKKAAKSNPPVKNRPLTDKMLSVIGQVDDPSSPDDARFDVFISYPQARMRWVEDQLYAPLHARRPDLRIFLERQAMPGGVGWLAHLAEMVHRCRVFLPVYCAEYFRSDYCQWELQLALIRDPIGRKRIVVPVQLESAALPHYCRLIQAEDATRPDFFDRLGRVLAEVLPRRVPEPR